MVKDLEVSFTDACINANDCPPYKPFCSNSGCVKECPVPFYKNNSECVHNCGDMFVEEDRTCVQTCSNTEFIDETLKFLRQEFIERKCVKSCPYFIFDNTCTNVCPPSSKLIMGDDLNMAEPGKRLCVERCPDTHLYKTNVTHGTTLATFCSKKCNVVVEDGYCVNICPGNKVYFNNSCVFSCPLSRPVLNKQRVCTELYTENINVETSTCNCPPGTFLASNTCLQTCPETMPYYCSFGTSTYTCYKTGSYPKSEYNNKFVCNTRCPNYKVDGKCLDKCPLDKPYTFNNVSLINCWYESCSGAIWENNCVNVCPDGYFTRNDGCTKTCENDEYVYNKSCLRHCPHDMKSRPDKIQYFELQEQSYGYVKKSIQKSTNICTELCADNEYQEDNICVTACPVFAFRKKCISECPKNALYTTAVVLRTCEQESCYTNYKLPMHTSCSEKCLTNMFSLNNSCVHYCPKPYMTAGRMCVLSCPKDLPYENATLFSIKEWREIDDTWSYKSIILLSAFQNAMLGADR
ncbi:proprotein convertase subtilisin/kexin type 5-like isoform X2 [Dreissena polymorpha]|uniref:proprotein convertase subtilisin/kexin type 5-like isoform X2 n=1 Tax=Dreissena polymorpha TaxID=45954 RepID=UPI002263C423|nr:proprotein convertase subtilisin/kexin type 5-like isoform X2 [Dreissena polymorpha]